MKDFIKKGLAEIKKEEILPTKRWVFKVKNFFWWISFGFSILIGGFSIAILVFLVQELDWQIYTNLGDSFLKTFLIMFPHFWIIFLGIFIFISYQNLRHTKKGYRYELIFILGITIGGSLLLGSVLYFSGLNQKLNRIFIEKVPGYERLIHTKEDQWSQPQRGLLSGEIISKTNSVLTLENAKKGIWQVTINNETLIRGRVNLAEGAKIKIIGKQESSGENNFEATEIKPWDGGGRSR